MNKFLLVLEFEIDDNKKYHMKAIRDNTVYAKEANENLLKLYYYIILKNYLEEKNT